MTSTSHECIDLTEDESEESGLSKDEESDDEDDVRAVGLKIKQTFPCKYCDGAALNWMSMERHMIMKHRYHKIKEDGENEGASTSSAVLESPSNSTISGGMNIADANDASTVGDGDTLEEPTPSTSRAVRRAVLESTLNSTNSGRLDITNTDDASKDGVGDTLDQFSHSSSSSSAEEDVVFPGVTVSRMNESENHDNSVSPIQRDTSAVITSHQAEPVPSTSFSSTNLYGCDPVSPPLSVLIPTSTLSLIMMLPVSYNNQETLSAGEDVIMTTTTDTTSDGPPPQPTVTTSSSFPDSSVSIGDDGLASLNSQEYSEEVPDAAGDAIAEPNKSLCDIKHEVPLPTASTTPSSSKIPALTHNLGPYWNSCEGKRATKPRIYDDCVTHPRKRSPRTRKNRNPGISSGGTVVYLCPVCERAFGRNNNLNRHMLTHFNPTCICQKCGRGFLTENGLRSHERHHVKKESLVLPRSGQPYKTSLVSEPASLLPNKRSFLCEKCGKRFLNKAGLGRHMRIHSGARPSVFPFCGSDQNQDITVKVESASCDIRGNSQLQFVEVAVPQHGSVLGLSDSTNLTSPHGNLK